MVTTVYNFKRALEANGIGNIVSSMKEDTAIIITGYKDSPEETYVFDKSGYITEKYGCENIQFNKLKVYGVKNHLIELDMYDSEMMMKHTIATLENRIRYAVQEEWDEYHRIAHDMFSKIARLRRELEQSRKEYEAAHNMTVSDSKDKRVRKVTEAVKDILKNKKVYDVNVDIDEKRIEVDVKDVRCFEPITGRYYDIGGATIFIPLTADGRILFRENIFSHLREGFWDKTDKRQIHPHVNTQGSPCLGNCEDRVVNCIISERWQDAFTILLDYLQSVDIGDCAGYAVAFWDEVDENGNLIREGHTPEWNEYDENYTSSEYCERYMCDICGELLRDDEAYTCFDCGRVVCEDHFSYVSDECVCTNCLSDHYYRCADCGEYVHVDYAYEHNGEWYCEDCYNEIEKDEEEN